MNGGLEVSVGLDGRGDCATLVPGAGPHAGGFPV